ncbi:NADH dehydrogenase [ubiquinone] 1 beta subcomplex subunit 4 [Leptinotarsa decemlineata]|uniref:NADH dehydrogenase [ubiquinone] 1 beta subcomplex subunit 4 n=1 Tax=Leptinotarsa decemlineata TaxID=7539 RepID=UPI000C2554DB|nr:NADH dehydrogenase [ubiquinone] 1 beta subcomplex subunit 4 [Leptinotarsa decemlineata]
MSQQYDVDDATRKLLEEKAKRRLVLREQFLKMKSDPFQHATGEGGTVFDPAMQRFQAMKVTGFEHFKPSPKNGIYGVLFVVVPMAIMTYAMQTSRDNKEASYRRGEVAYKDRSFKFI